MTNEVRAEDGAIAKGAQIVADSKVQLNAEIQNLEGKLANIGASWQGQSAVSFARLMDAWRTSARKITDNLDAFEANLTSSQTTYTTTDEESASTLGNLQARLG